MPTQKKEKSYLVYGFESGETCVPISAYSTRDARNKVASKTFKITRIKRMPQYREE